jgi:hypothetical protein
MDVNVAIQVYGAVAVPALHWMGLKPLLPGGPYSRFGFGLLASLFALFCLVFSNGLGAISIFSTGLPLVIFPIYAVLRNYFVRKIGREPIDTSFNMESGLGKNRLFDMAATLGLCLLAFLLIRVAAEMF